MDTPQIQASHLKCVIDKEACFSKLPVMIHCINSSGELIDVNDYWLTKMGYQRHEVLGKKSVDFMTRSSRQFAVEKTLPEFFRKGFCQDLAYTFVTKPGKPLNVLLSATSVRSSSGLFLHSYAVSIDVTEQHKLTKPDNAGDIDYHEILEGMLNGFALHEIICNNRGEPVDFRYLEVNSAFERITGLQAEKVIGKTILEVIPNTEKYWIETFGKVAITQQSIHFEKFSHELQRYFEVLAFSPAKNQFAVVLTNITNRKLAEEALFESERLFRRTFDQAPIGAAMVGVKGDFQKVNKEFCRISGYTREELLSMKVAEITFPDDLQANLQKINQLLQGEIRQFQIDKRIICKNSNVKWVRVSVRAIQDTKKRPLYLIPMIEDIDARKKLENEKEALLQLLTILSAESDLDKLIDKLLRFFQSFFPIDAIAIRLEQYGDYPYYQDVGLSEKHTLCDSVFTPCENGESMKPVCLCGYVIQGGPVSSPLYFTDEGSFSTASLSELLNQKDPSQNPKGLRDNCRNAGYESMLLVPLKGGGKILGLLQMMSKQKNHFSTETILLIERLAHYLSLAVLQHLTETELKLKKLEHEETNAALKVLLKNRENEILETSHELNSNIDLFVLPYIERLRLSNLNSQQLSQLNILENNLKSVLSALPQKGRTINSALTPKLNQVADLIRNGLTNKEIASVLGVTTSSVETYRKRIRKRLNLQNSKTNLRTYLVTYSGTSRVPI